MKLAEFSLCSGKIIKKIGPILVINEEFYNNYVAEKLN